VKTYRVVLDGGALSGFASDEVRRQLAKLTGRSEEVAAKLLGGRPSTVKRGIDETTASRYVDTLKKIGVASHLEREILELDLDEQAAAAPPTVNAAPGANPIPRPRGTAFAVRQDTVPIRKRISRSKAFAWAIAVVLTVGILSLMTVISTHSDSGKPLSLPDRSASTTTLTPEQQAQQDRQRERDAWLEQRKKQFAAQRSSLVAQIKRLNAAHKYAEAFELGSQWLALDPELDAQTDIAREKVAAQTERAEQERKTAGLQKTDASHKRGICGEITKGVDLLLYDRPGHGATATCSYTDDWLLIIGEERMRRFRFLSFIVVGGLRNDDFLLPDQVYVGYGTECWVMRTNDAATSQRLVKSWHDDATAWMTIASLPRVGCPK
jgi:hypothetical protein